MHDINKIILLRNIAQDLHRYIKKVLCQPVTPDRIHKKETHSTPLRMMKQERRKTFDLIGIAG
jgi:hypothetical protein